VTAAAVRNLAADIRRFQDIRQKRSINTEAIRECERPPTFHDIEQRRTRRIGNIADMNAGELEPNVVFRQEKLSNACEVCRFVVANPEQLGQCESGQYRIGGVGENGLFTGKFVDAVDLSLAALVAPDQCGANDLIVCIKQHEAMHLSGEPNTANIGATDPGGLKDAADSQLRGVPPVFRALLGPERTLHPHLVVRGREGMADLAGRIH
jgi:hypothetical protein